MNYYISDYHLDHKNVLTYDGRPFETIKEMFDVLLANALSVLKPGDTLFILGDIAMGGNYFKVVKAFINVIKAKGVTVHLITGNHDKIDLNKLDGLFESISDFKIIKDGDYTVTMSHYPMPTIAGHFKNGYVHLYGHVHNTFEDTNTNVARLFNLLDSPSKEANLMLNVGCMMPYMDYTPQPLSTLIPEIIKQNEKLLEIAGQLERELDQIKEAVETIY